MAKSFAESGGGQVQLASETRRVHQQHQGGQGGKGAPKKGR